MAGEVYFDFNLDFGNVSIPRRLRITQYGDLLPVLRAKLYNMGTVYSIPEDASVSVRWKKPTETVVYNAVTTFSGNAITYPVDQQCLAASGLCSVCFEITTDGKAIETPVFAVEVVKNPVQDDDIEDSPQLGALDQAIADVTEQAQKMFDETAQHAKDEADRLIAESSGAVDAAAKSAADASLSADRADEAAKRAESYAPTDGTVLSVNGKGGAVTLNAEDVGAIPAPEKPISGAVLIIGSISSDTGAITTETISAEGYGLSVSSGRLQISPANAEQLASMSDAWSPIVPSLLPLAVKLALSSAWVSAAWTESDRANVRNTIGAADAAEIDRRLAALEARVEALELTGGGGSGAVDQPYSADFSTMSGLVYTGVWNQPLQRLEF